MPVSRCNGCQLWGWIWRLTNCKSRLLKTATNHHNVLPMQSRMAVLT